MIMHDVERTARSGANNISADNGSTKETLDYITPTSADKGVNAYRTWWNKYGLSKAPPHTFGPASPSNLRHIPRHEYVNPWWMHTKSCAHCRHALKNARRLEKWSLALGLLTSVGASAFGCSRPVISLLAASLGLLLSSIGKKLVVAFEGSSHLSDIPDRYIPLE